MCPQNLGCAVTESCYLQRMTSEEGEVSFDSTLTPHGVEGTCEIITLSRQKARKLPGPVPESRAWAVI